MAGEPATERPSWLRWDGLPPSFARSAAEKDDVLARWWKAYAVSAAVAVAVVIGSFVVTFATDRPFFAATLAGPAVMCGASAVRGYRAAHPR